MPRNAFCGFSSHFTKTANFKWEIFFPDARRREIIKFCGCRQYASIKCVHFRHCFSFHFSRLILLLYGGIISHSFSNMRRNFPCYARQNLKASKNFSLHPKIHRKWFMYDEHSSVGNYFADIRFIISSPYRLNKLYVEIPVLTTCFFFHARELMISLFLCKGWELKNLIFEKVMWQKLNEMIKEINMTFLKKILISIACSTRMYLAQKEEYLKNWVHEKDTRRAISIMCVSHSLSHLHTSLHI